MIESTQVGVGLDVVEHVEEMAPREISDASLLNVDASLEVREQRVMMYAAPEYKMAVRKVRSHRAAVGRTHRKAAKMKRDADSMHLVIRRSRFERLDDHAKKHDWSASVMPAEAAGDARLKGWWEEWRQLKEMGLQLR